MSTPAPAPLGVVGRYNLLERLEPSGPGELFRARDTHRGRTVAVRLLPPGYSGDAESRARLVADARALTAMSHPNITTLFEADEHDGRVFLAFEYVRGGSLRAEMAGRPMNPRRAAEIAVQIADAVAEAHAAGFAHGGLSPDSILVTDKGHAKIPTFHLASLVGFSESASAEGLRDYVSPEEERGEHPDDRSDVYSVGAIAYEMLTARRPSPKGASAPSAWNPRVPKELDDIVLKAIAPNPESRQQSAAALAAALRGLASMLEARDEPDEESTQPAGRSVGTPLVLAVALLLAAALLVWWFMRA